MVFFPKLFARSLCQLPPIAPVVWLLRHLLGITHPYQAKDISAYNPVILILTLKAYLFLICSTLALADVTKQNPRGSQLLLRYYKTLAWDKPVLAWGTDSSSANGYH
jgi:hypothetical protein